MTSTTATLTRITGLLRRETLSDEELKTLATSLWSMRQQDAVTDESAIVAGDGTVWVASDLCVTSLSRPASVTATSGTRFAVVREDDSDHLRCRISEDGRSLVDLVVDA